MMVEYTPKISDVKILIISEGKIYINAAKIPLYLRVKIKDDTVNPIVKLFI